MKSVDISLWLKVRVPRFDYDCLGKPLEGQIAELTETTTNLAD